jgi:hypothetical protein
MHSEQLAMADACICVQPTLFTPFCGLKDMKAGV